MQSLPPTWAHAHPRRDPLDEAHQLSIEEGDAQLETRSHRHLVVAEEDRVREHQPGIEV
jgi:hypothetical protein